MAEAAAWGTRRSPLAGLIEGVVEIGVELPGGLLWRSTGRGRLLQRSRQAKMGEDALDHGGAVDGLHGDHAAPAAVVDQHVMVKDVLE